MKTEATTGLFFILVTILMSTMKLTDAAAQNTAACVKTFHDKEAVYSKNCIVCAQELNYPSIGGCLEKCAGIKLEILDHNGTFTDLSKFRKKYLLENKAEDKEIVKASDQCVKDHLDTTKLKKEDEKECAGYEQITKLIGCLYENLTNQCKDKYAAAQEAKGGA